MNDKKEKWITINGAHILLKDGQSKVDFSSLSKSGKQKNKNDSLNSFSAKDYAEGIIDKNYTPDDKGFEYMIKQMHDPELKDKILETEQKLKGLVSTHDRHYISGEGADTIYDKERMKKHEEWIDDYFSNPNLRGENAVCAENETPTLILLGGRGGSGKSKFDGLVYDRKNVIVIDADEVKKLIPEYKEWNAMQVHEESSVLMKKIVKEAYNRRMNVVIDQTMSNVGSSLKYLDQFKGYNTEAHYMFVPPQISVSRAMYRFKNDGKSGKYTGRFVPIKILLNMNENEIVFDNVKSKVGKWSFYSNYGVGKDDPPTLIAKK